MKNSKKRGKTVLDILKYLNRYHMPILLSALLAMASVAISIYVPIRIGNAIDLILGKGDHKLLAVHSAHICNNIYVYFR